METQEGADTGILSKEQITAAQSKGIQVQSNCGNYEPLLSFVPQYICHSENPDGCDTPSFWRRCISDNDGKTKETGYFYAQRMKR